MSEHESTTSSSNTATVTNRDAPDGVSQEEELRAQLDVLEEENRRLREEYVRARRSQYRQAAIGLGVVGLMAILSAALFPIARDVLLVLGATGIFGAVLTYYLTPERFISADVGERIYAMLATNESRLAGELGLTDLRVYVPAARPGAESPARLFVPQQTPYELPDDEDLQSTLIVGDDDQTRGLALAPSGGGLYREFERALTGPLGELPGDVTTQIIDALVEDFELVDAAEADINVEDGHVAIHVTDSAYGSPEFDHPVQSFAAVTLSTALDTPVTTETTQGDTASEFTVVCRWDASDIESGNETQDDETEDLDESSDTAD